MRARATARWRVLAWAVDVACGGNVGAATVKGKGKDLTFAAGLGSVLLIHVKAITYPIYTPVGIGIIARYLSPTAVVVAAMIYVITKKYKWIVMWK